MMNEFDTIRRVIENTDSIEQALIEISEEIESLELYDWDEIFSFVPNSDDVRSDIVNSIDAIKNILQYKLGGV